MVDGLTPQDPTQASSAGGRKGFLGSKGGRIGAIVGGVVVLLAILGVAAYLLLPSLFGKEEIKPSAKATTGTKAAGTSKTGKTAPEEPPTEPDEVPLSDVFTFRDIFDPLIKPVPAEEASGALPGTLPGTSPDVSADTLFLQDIIVTDGKPYAVLLFNDVEYTLTEGEGIAGTPWQVLQINENSVVMLFGDVQVTLTIGQGVAK